MQPKPMEIPKHGTCEMCGKPGQTLWMLFIGDYAGWTCIECIGKARSAGISPRANRPTRQNKSAFICGKEKKCTIKEMSFQFR